MEAISDLIGEQAAQNEAVVAFRREALNNRLLSAAQAVEWIRRRAGIDEFTTYLIVPIPPGTELRFRHTMEKGYAISPKIPIEISENWPAVHTEFDVLVHFSGNRALQRPVAAGGVLDRLRIVSESLADLYGWSKAEATDFVLTGNAPRISSFKARYQDNRVLALARIVLTLDPALSPREVTQKYQEARKCYVGNRHRSMSKKHTNLERFICTRPKGETYARAMAVWNKQYPKWKYIQETNFGRDVKAARRRLLGSERYDVEIGVRKEKEQ